MSDYAAIIVSCLALFFTVFSFWWMNWRPGHLRFGIPRTYAAFATLEGKMVIELPIDMFNDAPLPVILRNLRLVFLDEPEPRRPLSFIAVLGKLANSDARSFATQIPVRGREAVVHICEFQRQPGGRVLDAGTYMLRLEAQLDDNLNWIPTYEFPLNVSENAANTIKSALIVHDNLAD